MKSKIIILIFIIFMLSGCYDSKELNNISILTATEISKDGNNFVVNAQVVNPQSPDKTMIKQAPFIIYQGVGKSILEAYRNIKLESSRYLYPDHLQIMIINEKLAKEDISQILDFYLRDPSIRTEFNVLIGHDDNILSVITPIDELSSSSILGTIKTNNKFLGVASLITFDELAIMNLNPNKEIILPSIKLVNNKKDKDKLDNVDETNIKTKYKIGGLAVFKDNKLLDYLSDNESITYNLIKNNVENSVITYECNKNKYMSLEIINSKSNIKIDEGKIIINIKMDTTINESRCNVKLNNSKEIKKLTRDIELYIKDNINEDINSIRNNYNSDVFGFLDEIYKHNYKMYKDVKDNWYNGIYKNIPIDIDVKMDIVGKGNIMEGNDEKN